MQTILENYVDVDGESLVSADELDFLSSATTPTLVASPSPDDLGIAKDTGRNLRPRSIKLIVPSKPSKPKSVKRKRSSNQLTLDSFVEETSEKRAKLDAKMARTIVVNNKKVTLDVARRRWLHLHRHLFTPLLPESSNFFDDLEKETANNMGYVPLKELDRQPDLIKGGEMKDYQLHGLSYLAWMYNNGMNCILGDEMGLGKTLQTLSLFAYIKDNSKGDLDPHLIICPLSVLSSWQAEAARWIPSSEVLRFHGSQSERDRIKRGIRDSEITFDICITTYESYVAEHTWFKYKRWTYVVLDEGHKIKNSETDISNKLQGIGSLYRLILTGTPVQNDLVELWGLLRWLYPDIFKPSSERIFGDSFDLSRGKYASSIVTAAKNLLDVIMLRRTKAVVEISVPPREELTVFIPMSEAQRFWTYRLLMRMDTAELVDIFSAKLEDHHGSDSNGSKEVQEYIATQLKRGKTAETNRWAKLMNLLMQLRKVCDHPFLLPNAEPDPYVVGEHLVASSSKLIAVDKLLADLLPKGERVLIFSQWTSMLDLLEDFMALRSIPYARLDGSTSRPRRALDIKLFQKEKSPYQVYLISTKAGGLGINLTKASTVIMFDSDWNPQNDLQAIARAHRIGQTQIVKVYRLVCQGSVEDQMLDRLRRKLYLSVKLMGSDNPNSDDGNSESNLGVRDLMDILRKGSSALSSTVGMDLTEFLDAPIEKTLEASRSRDDLREAKMRKDLGEDVAEKSEKTREELLAEVEEEERKLLSGVAQVQSRLFEGKVIQRKNNKDIANEWQELQKRARYDRIVMVDGHEAIAANIGPEVSVAIPKPPKRERKHFESEDWCIYCRDGGDLALCNWCPRVFHPKCHGMTKQQVARASSLSCSQHSCTECLRNTSDAGGMLFRCQTCSRAFCEDCIPLDEIETVGDTLPEFLLCEYGAHDNAYYIRCHYCLEEFAENPKVWEQWQEDMQQTEKKLNALEAKASAL